MTIKCHLGITPSKDCYEVCMQSRKCEALKMLESEVNRMRMNEPCNLDVPDGATPMTIADVILRECDDEVLDEVLYYIDCFRKYRRDEETEGSTNV